MFIRLESVRMLVRGSIIERTELEILYGSMSIRRSYHQNRGVLS
jgi:hypothetical protein